MRRVKDKKLPTGVQPPRGGYDLTNRAYILPTESSIVVLMGAPMPLAEFVAYLRMHEAHWPPPHEKTLDNAAPPTEAEILTEVMQSWCNVNLMSVYVVKDKCYVGWEPGVSDRIKPAPHVITVQGLTIMHDDFYGGVGLLTEERLQRIHLRIPLTDEAHMNTTQQARLSQLRSGDLEPAHEFHNIHAFVDVNMDYWHTPAVLGR